MNTGFHRILIVGGGAGGVELSTRLGRLLSKKGIARTILVDQSPTHIWKPLLHEVATGALNTGEDEINYFSHAHSNHYEFEFGRMSGINRSKKVIELGPISDPEDPSRHIVGSRQVKYDTLVLSVGAVTNFFGTKGALENCLTLNTPADAERLRKRILSQALSVVTGNAGIDKLRIGIVGAGATGVELAAEIHHTIAELRNCGSNLMSEQLEIILMEGAPRILSAAPQSLSEYATHQLKERNIQVKTNCLIKSVTDKGFILADGKEVPAEIRIWTAGIKGPEWLSTLGLKVNKINQIVVNEDLQSVDDSNIFAFGDCSLAPWGPNSKYLPATAQVANQQAEWLTTKLSSRLSGQKCKSFSFNPKGMLVSLGETRAVGSLAAIVGPKRDYYVEGRMAKLLYASLYRMHQAVLFGWTRSILLLCGDKLRKVALPQLKLH